MSRKQKSIEHLRPIDDVFFEVLMENPKVCQEVLRVILENNTLEVISSIPQRSIKNLRGRSVRMDVLCRLEDGRLCNVEVQTSRNDDQIKRVRYHAACITAANTGIGEKFITVPDVLMVFISTYDIFKMGKTIYHCQNVIRETGQIVDNGLQEIYVNTAVKDGSEISELMQCLIQESVENEKFPMLSREVWYYKNDEGGRRDMCEIVDNLFEERNIEQVKILFREGGTLEVAMKVFSNLSERVLKELYEEVNGQKN